MYILYPDIYPIAGLTAATDPTDGRVNQTLEALSHVNIVKINRLDKLLDEAAELYKARGMFKILCLMQKQSHSFT